MDKEHEKYRDIEEELRRSTIQCRVLSWAPLVWGIISLIACLIVFWNNGLMQPNFDTEVTPRTLVLAGVWLIVCFAEIIIGVLVLRNFRDME